MEYEELCPDDDADQLGSYSAFGGEWGWGFDLWWKSMKWEYGRSRDEGACPTVSEASSKAVGERVEVQWTMCDADNDDNEADDADGDHDDHDAKFWPSLSTKRYVWAP